MSICHFLADVSASEGRSAEAYELYTAAKEAHEGSRMAPSREYAMVLHRIGELCCAQNRRGEAMETWWASKAAYEASSCDSSADYAALLFGMASNSAGVGSHAQARDFYAIAK